MGTGPGGTNVSQWYKQDRLFVDKLFCYYRYTDLCFPYFM